MIAQYVRASGAIESVAPSPAEFASTRVSSLIIDTRSGEGEALTAALRPLRHVASTIESVDVAGSWLRDHDVETIVLFAASRAGALDGTRQIRVASALPLIVVGPDASAESRVGVFEAGAQDYIAAPVTATELDRRVRVLVRREQFRDRDDALYGPEGLVMYPRAYEAHLGAEPLALTPKEFGVLQVLLELRGEVVVPDRMSLSIWGYETFGSKNFVEAHVSRLRRKLSRAGAVAVIRTVRGVGYVIR